MQAPRTPTTNAEPTTPGLIGSIRGSALRRLGRPLLMAYVVLFAVAVLVGAVSLMAMWRGSH
jgi:hypothetical protein